MSDNYIVWSFKENPSWQVTQILKLPSWFSIKDDEVVVIIEDDITNVEIWDRVVLTEQYVPVI